MAQEDQEFRRTDPISKRVIGACIEVHRTLGPGLLESAYEACLVRELSLGGMSVRRQVPLAIDYKGAQVDCAYRIDLLVCDSVVVELKSVDQLLPIHLAQVLTYLKLSGHPIGLLVNFNVPALRRGLRRLTLQQSPVTF